MNLATSLPGPSGRGDFAANDRVRRDGTPIWLEACAAAGVARVLQQSIAMVSARRRRVGRRGRRSVRADGGSIAGDAIAAALAMEDAVQASPLDWLILRGGLFYGPGTGFDDDWFARAAAGKLRLPGDGTRLRLADPHRGHGRGDRARDPALAVAPGADRRRRRARALA